MEGDWSVMVVSKSVGQTDLDAFHYFMETPDFTMFAVKDFRTCRKEFEQEDEEDEDRL